VSARQVVKRLLAAGYITVCLAVSLVLTACTSSPAASRDAAPHDAASVPGNENVYVIRPNHYRDSAFIEHLGSGLAVLERTELSYAGLENAWGVPAVSKGIVYVVAQGVEGARDARLVIGFDPITGEMHEYPVNHPALKSVAATDQYLFVTSVINNVSTITRVDKDSAKTLDAVFTGDFLVGITACGNRLAVLRQPGFDFSGDAELLILDENMELLETRALTGLGSANSMTLVAEDMLCFGTHREDAASPTHYRNALNLYSPATGEMRTIAESDYRYGFAAVDEACLIVLQSEANVADGNRIAVFDLVTGEPRSQTVTDYLPQYLLVEDGLLYVAGFDRAQGDYCLQCYRIDEGSLSLLTETRLGSAGLPADDYGIGGLFAAAD
jgi:hypothetical protein